MERKLPIIRKSQLTIFPSLRVKIVITWPDSLVMLVGFETIAKEEAGFGAGPGRQSWRRKGSNMPTGQMQEAGWQVGRSNAGGGKQVKCRRHAGQMQAAGRQNRELQVFSFSPVLCRRPPCSSISSNNILKPSAPGRHGRTATKFQVSLSLDFQLTDVQLFFFRCHC